MNSNINKNSDLIIAPSILSANLLNFKEDLDHIHELKNKTQLSSDSIWVHVDVMDGSFVPPITFGDNIVKSCRSHIPNYLDVHLMIDNPHKHFKTFVDAGADSITFHLEAYQSNNLESLLSHISDLKSLGVKAGLSIKPKTDFSEFQHLIEYLDLLLIMTVEPGYGGQKFISETVSKITSSKALIDKNNLDCIIQVDGGINEKTAKICYEAGARSFVAGSFIFSSDPSTSPAQQVTLLLDQLA